MTRTWQPSPIFIARRKKEVRIEASSLTLEERLARYVVEGSKDGLTEDLKLALEKYVPLEIINGPLMAGMEEVGRLFNGNQLIVAEVLQSAEVMKASVSFLEPFMEKSDAAAKGKILLATVKGDVHDIGKTWSKSFCQTTATMSSTWGSRYRRSS